VQTLAIQLPILISCLIPTQQNSIDIVVIRFYFVEILLDILCVCRIRNSVLLSFMTYHRLCNKSDTTVSTINIFGASVYCFVDNCLSFCLFSFDHCIVSLSLWIIFFAKI